MFIRRNHMDSPLCFPSYPIPFYQSSFINTSESSWH